MPRVAIAVPEADAQAIHDELLKDDPSKTFTSTAYACRRCGTLFAIFFMNSHDQNNPTYADKLRGKIADNCEHGRHTFDGLPLAVD
jgi:hypothetical protein